jgi:four helix bundle protein
MRRRAKTHRDLEVYAKAFAVAMMLYELSKEFPRDEMYSLTDQMRRSSRSVCANIAEPWRKRRYPAAFISILSDAETEAAESRYGSNSPSNAATSRAMSPPHSTKSTTKSSAPLSE